MESNGWGMARGADLGGARVGFMQGWGALRLLPNVVRASGAHRARTAVRGYEACVVARARWFALWRRCWAAGTELRPLCGVASGAHKLAVRFDC